jgi:hypothetical protein
MSQDHKKTLRERLEDWWSDHGKSTLVLVATILAIIITTPMTMNDIQGRTQLADATAPFETIDRTSIASIVTGMNATYHNVLVIGDFPMLADDCAKTLVFIQTFYRANFTETELLIFMQELTTKLDDIELAIDSNLGFVYVSIVLRYAATIMVILVVYAAADKYL